MSFSTKKVSILKLRSTEGEHRKKAVSSFYDLVLKKNNNMKNRKPKKNLSSPLLEKNTLVLGRWYARLVLFKKYIKAETTAKKGAL